MAGTVNNVTRTQDASGDAIAAFEKDDGGRAQAMVLDPEVHGEALDNAITAGASPADQLVVKASPGRLFQAEVVLISTPAGTRWLMAFNAAAAVINGAEPVWRSPQIASNFASIDRGVWGLLCDTGIVLALSSTPGTLTLPADNLGLFQAAYL